VRRRGDGARRLGHRAPGAVVGAVLGSSGGAVARREGIMSSSPTPRTARGPLVVLAAIVVVAVGAHLVTQRLRLRARTLQELGAVPAFRLTDQQGRPFATADLDGKVWVVDFFFSRCTGVCPL